MAPAAAGAPAAAPPAQRGGSSSRRSSNTTSWFGLSEELVSGLAFCATSAAMTLLNKAALSAFHFTAPTSLLCFQCSVTLLLVAAANAAGFGRWPALSVRLLQMWLPVNVLFVGMVWTSFYALRSIGVAMVTVLKNLTNFLVIAGDYAFFGKSYSRGVWATLFLMLASAIASAATDLAFDARGYSWQMVNNAFTAAYSLALRGVITRMGAIAAGGGGSGGPARQPGGGSSSSASLAAAAPTDELGMVVYNNLLSIPMILGLVFATGEAGRLAAEPALGDRRFLAAAVVSAALSFLISIASMWFLSCTTATTFSLVGSLNKIPLALLGMLLFSAPTSTNNVISVLIGLAAGVVFAHAKSQASSGASSSVRGSSSALQGGGGAAASGGGRLQHSGGSLPRHAAHHSIQMQPLKAAAEQQPLLRPQ